MPNNKIFVSYRRQDASGEAGRLVDDLQDVFGEESVFLDVETLEAGLDFVVAIDQALNSCKVLIAIIGPHWAKIKDAEGNLRLFEEGDFIRIEIAAALERNIRVIPVLVNGAKMPSNSDLPEELQALNRRHAHELSSSRWKYDTEQLVGILSKIIEPKKKTDPTPPPRPTPRPRPVPVKKQKSWFARNFIWVVGGFVVIAILFSLGSEDFQEGFEEGYNEAVTTDNSMPTATELLEDFESQQNEPKISSEANQTSGSSQSTTVNITGLWSLTAADGSFATIRLNQLNSDVEYYEYNALNDLIGTGTGFWEDNVLYIDAFNSFLQIGLELELVYSNPGTLTGELYVPSNNYTTTVTLTVIP